jgi:hypothetical protein
MPKHYRHRTDFNQPAIMASLRANGCKVIDLSVVGDGCPDLLALLPDGTLRLIEVKNPDGRDRLTDKQKDFMSQGWPVAIVHYPCQASAIANP